MGLTLTIIMHEYSIAVDIIRIAEKKAFEAGMKKVMIINLVIGDYCGFLPESIQMYFDEISKNTQCENAELVIKRIEPKLKCSCCGLLFKRKLFSFECPVCGGEGNPTDIGKEFYLESIEGV